MSSESANATAHDTGLLSDYSPASLLCLALVVVATITLHFMPDPGEMLRYQRDTFQVDAWSPLLAGIGHMLVHLNAQHALLNVVALLCIYLLFSEAFGSAWWLVALGTSGVVSLYGLYYYSPATSWCIGMSGALHGLFIYAVLRSRAHSLWLVAIIAKLVIEQQQWPILEPLLATSQRFIGYNVVVDAHLWGAAGGLLFYAVSRCIAALLVLREIASERQE